MSKQTGHKSRILCLYELLLTQTDEQHPLSVVEMIEFLKEQGFETPQRKTIYNDLEHLRNFGLDLVSVRTNTVRYYVASRTFELPEVTLLIDSVQGSKFITEQKTRTLLKKLESLTSVHEARRLQGQIVLRGRVKSMNESVYYNVDALSSAISENCQVTFQYFHYDIHKQEVLRNEGHLYVVSPYALIIDNENYYLLAYDADSRAMKHYRVDRMKHIQKTDDARQGAHLFEKIDLSSYTKQVFGMFHGDLQQVRMRFHNHLINGVIDQFGDDVSIVPDGDSHFTVSAQVVVSPQFFAWLFRFGAEASLIGPPSVREAYRKQLKETLAEQG